MTVDKGRGRSRREYHVLFVALTRRWWRGALLSLVIAVGGVLALWWDGQRMDGTGALSDVSPPSTAVSTVVPESDEVRRSVPEDEPALEAVATVATTVETRSTSATPSVATPGVVASPVRDHPFDDLRLERERQRSRQAEMLQLTAQDDSVSEARRRDAHEQLLTLWKMEAREAEIEHLLRAQGYTGVIVLSESGAHVVVDGLLDAAGAGHIGALVSRVSGVRREAITIVDGITSGR